MLRFARNKFHKVNLVALAFLMPSNLSFCFPAVSHARAVEGETVMEFTNISSIAENCQADGHHGAQINEPAKSTGEVKNTGDNQSPSNNLLPCCQGHDTLTKVDTPKEPDFSQDSLYFNNSCDSHSSIAKPADSSLGNQVDLPPPKINLTGSVYKKE